MRGTSVPGSIAASERTAGGQDRVRLRRHARPGQARPQRHHVDVAGGQHLGQALVGLVARRSARWRRPGRRRLRAAAGADPPPLTTNVTSGIARGPRRPAARATGRSRRCRRRAPPSRRRCRARAGTAVIRSPGRMRSVSTKFGITRTVAAPVGAAPWPPRCPQVVGQHRDGVARAGSWCAPASGRSGDDPPVR